ncbi:putative porin [Sphingomonas sp.]|uniref:putative porin n=1 Tax=Sphingomonas sp. TaxID=28214 RepID=UPI002ED8720C
MRGAFRSALAATALAALPVQAQESRLDALERRLAEQQARIQQLEAQVAQQAAQLKQGNAPIPATPVPQIAAAVPAPPPAPAITLASSAAAFHIPGVDVSGDLRVRQEWNTGAARNRSRSALRARLRASYAVSDRFAIGAELATGDPDDPNSTDVTLGNFLDDLNVSLDQAWIRYTAGGLIVHAGKFPQIFQRTDMIWDGDVLPEGLGASYALDLGNGTRLDARALYFVIDEAPTARDSDMLGGQINAAVPLASDLRLALSGSYYHYRLGSIAGADAGDFRGNLVSGGRYLSDFHLVEGLGTLTYAGLSPRWPLALTADYVRNLGAAVPGDTGFSVELAAGRIAQRGDWRAAYTYSEVQVDAVFAAFSHDNLDLSTNYQLHGFGLGYVPASNLLLDLAWYHYRPLDARYTTAPPDWLDRVRLNFMVSF